MHRQHHGLLTRPRERGDENGHRPGIPQTEGQRAVLHPDRPSRKWTERQAYNNVLAYIPAEQAIKNAAVSTETDNQAVAQYFLNPNSDKRIVVFGHTHVAKIESSINHNGKKSIYANSGTWIDHNKIGTTMDFVIIAPQNNDTDSQTLVTLYNFANETITKVKEDFVKL